jgi:hypothetical protein
VVVTQQRKPSPYPRRGQRQETSYERALKAHEEAYATWEQLWQAEEFQAALAALDEAFAAMDAARILYDALWAPIEVAGQEVDRTYTALQDALAARMAELTAS